ncbi:hypothetical protein BC941DRAFT_439462 [Chlamydoabsidia padenii]|nr:hypothetical protein BC941DRAFT_439462 [Chlamydoabsidia padenii]
MTTTHDVHRAIEENLFNSFQRHSSIHSPATASLASFRSMTASDLIGLLPGTPHSSSSHRHGQQQQQRGRMARDRPASDILHPHLSTNIPSSTSAHLTEAEAIDQWFENIQRYEQMLEEVAAASLDETFKDELQHVNQWIRCRSDAERTAALYSVVQNASQIQIRFLIMVLQQLANQEPFGNLLTSAGQDKDSFIGPVAGSVVSTESEYERRKRQMYPPTHRHGMNHTTRSPIRITSASSEPDDLRRNSDLFGSSRFLVDSSKISSVLGRQGLLHEKALAARAQIQAVNGGRTVGLGSAKSDSINGRIQQPLLSSTSSTPTNATSSSSSSSSASLDSPSSDTLQQHPSLFGTDWPFPLTRHTPERSSLVGRIGDHRSTISKASSLDETWSFGSLSKKKKDLIDLPSWNGRKSGPIREEQESLNDLPARHLNMPASSKTPSSSTNHGMMTSSLHNSLNTLEQAQARLRGESTRPRQWPRTPIQMNSDTPRTMKSNLDSKLDSTPTLGLGNSSNSSRSSTSSNTSIGIALTPPLVYSNMTSKRNISPSPSGTPTASLITTRTSSPSLISPATPTTDTSSSLQSKSPIPPIPLGNQFTTPPTVYENEMLETMTPANSGYQSDHSEGSTTSVKENVLTGTARRRKRSSAARALKDKIAAETVDLDLMKDVQNWLRSLRLHKYGHAFDGLQWQQVVRMNDQDMIDAGVNTIGARRKLLKVFENVQRYCDENNIVY